MEYHVTNPTLPPNHELVGELCLFCHRPFESGDVTKFVPSGPADEIELVKARRDLPHLDGPPIELHYDCGDTRCSSVDGSRVADSATNATGNGGQTCGIVSRARLTKHGTRYA